MTISEFIALFDKDAVENGKVAFVFHHPTAGKYRFWCEKGDTKEDLVKDIAEHECLASYEIDGFEEVFFDPYGGALNIIITMDDCEEHGTQKGATDGYEPIL